MQPAAAEVKPATPPRLHPRDARYQRFKPVRRVLPGVLGLRVMLFGGLIGLAVWLDTYVD